MKLKCLPEDFQVQEQIALAPGSGPFALYRLTKSSLGTPEAIDAIAERWRLRRGQIAFAGLKDKHALTQQFVTIHGGPRRGLAQTNLELEYVGQVDRPIHARDITSNRFEIVLRDMTEDETASARLVLAEIERDGLPNYFDSQRFGSVGQSGEFIAKPWCLGDYERALWLSLAEPNVHDRPEDREQKATLARLWGNWDACAAALRPSLQRQAAALLAQRPGDFKRALTVVPQGMRSIYLAAFQSDLWNRWLAALLRSNCRPQQLTTLPVGPRQLPFYTTLDDAQRSQLHALQLPLPSARLHMEASPLTQLLDGVLAEEQMELRQVRVKFPRDTFFSKGSRGAVLAPQQQTFAAGKDELHRGRQKVTLRFDLPRGSYATLLTKRLGAPAIEPSEENEPPQND